LEFAPQIVAKLREKARRYAELTTQLSDPEIAGDHVRYTGLLREQGLLESANRLAARMGELIERRSQAQEMIADDTGADPEMLELVREELASLKELEGDLDREIKTVLVSDPQWDRNKIIVEIRAGAGGDEATLFTGDLFRMYQRFSEECGFRLELMSDKTSEVGGFKEIVFGVRGDNAFRWFRFESGGHRVQRVPTTESQGRIHTSAATVAVLPEAEDVDLQIKPEDLRIDTMRASGAGGQHVNKTESAVRIVHLPTDTMVVCMDEKSQHKNRAQAMRILRSRLFEAERRRLHDERAEARRSQVGTGDRSDRVRTYNFPQNRCSDHRIGRNFSLEQVMAGRLEPLVKELHEKDIENRIETL
jgi:peptide chain release factor 1